MQNLYLNSSEDLSWFFPRFCIEVLPGFLLGVVPQFLFWILAQFFYSNFSVIAPEVLPWIYLDFFVEASRSSVLWFSPKILSRVFPGFAPRISSETFPVLFPWLLRFLSEFLPGSLLELFTGFLQSNTSKVYSQFCWVFQDGCLTVSLGMLTSFLQKFLLNVSSR